MYKYINSSGSLPPYLMKYYDDEDDRLGEILICRSCKTPHLIPRSTEKILALVCTACGGILERLVEDV